MAPIFPKTPTEEEIRREKVRLQAQDKKMNDIAYGLVDQFRSRGASPSDALFAMALAMVQILSLCSHNKTGLNFGKEFANRMIRKFVLFVDKPKSLGKRRALWTDYIPSPPEGIYLDILQRWREWQEECNPE